MQSSIIIKSIMVNNEINGRAARLIEPDYQSSTVRNEESEWRSSSALSAKRSPMMYMNQQAMATYDAIKKQDLLETQLTSRSNMRRWCFSMKKSMITSPARNFVISVAAGFLFNLSFMASIIIIYEKVRHLQQNNIVCPVHPSQLLRLLNINGPHNCPDIHADSACHSYDILSGSGFTGQGLPSVAQRISRTCVTSSDLLGMPACDLCQPDALHR